LTSAKKSLYIAGQCCDLIFLAGWPKPFYGGSGGFIGYTKNRIFVDGLIFDFIFWLIICLILLKIFFLFKPAKFKKKKISL